MSFRAAVPDARWIDHIPLLDAITREGIRIEAGEAVPIDGPGLGIARDWDAIVARRPMAMSPR